MVNQIYAEAISETLDILEHTRKEDVDKISPKFMEYLRNNASPNYISSLDHSKKISDMELKEKTKVVLNSSSSVNAYSLSRLDAK